MLTVKNVIFVTSLKHGACLLFDRKGLGYKQTKQIRNPQPVKNFFHRLHAA